MHERLPVGLVDLRDEQAFDLAAAGFAGAEQTRREDAGVVGHQHVPRAQPAGQIPD